MSIEDLVKDWGTRGTGTRVPVFPDGWRIRPDAFFGMYAPLAVTVATHFSTLDFSAPVGYTAERGQQDPNNVQLEEN